MQRKSWVAAGGDGACLRVDAVRIEPKGCEGKASGGDLRAWSRFLGALFEDFMTTQGVAASVPSAHGCCPMGAVPSPLRFEDVCSKLPVRLRTAEMGACGGQMKIAARRQSG
jgi:hypothetical protein